MAKPLHPDYLYIDSDLLKQRVAFHKKSGWLFCEDIGRDGKLVSYSPRELEVFRQSGEPITMAVHMVKKIIGGEVVGYERQGNGNAGTATAGKQSACIGNTSHNGGEISGVSRNGAAVRDGELDIY